MNLSRKTRLLVEGSWAVPYTLEQAKELEELLSKPLPADQASKDILYNLMGDDKLFDQIDASEDEGNKDVRPLIRSCLREWLQQYQDSPETFRSKFETQALDLLWKLTQG